MTWNTGGLAELRDVFRWESVPWLKRAACRSHPKGWWFADKYSKLNKAQIRKAKSICKTCPVRWECLSRYIDEPFFVWGGFDEDERVQMRRSLHVHRRSPAQLKAKFEERPVEITGRATRGKVLKDTA